MPAGHGGFVVFRSCFSLQTAGIYVFNAKNDLCLGNSTIANTGELEYDYIRKLWEADEVVEETG